MQNPSAPVAVATYQVPNHVRDIAFGEDLAFVVNLGPSTLAASDSPDLLVIDALGTGGPLPTLGALPKITGSSATTRPQMKRARLIGGKLYCLATGGSRQLQIVDVDSASTPQRIAAVNLGTVTYGDVVGNEDYLYLVDGDAVVVMSRNSESLTPEIVDGTDGTVRICWPREWLGLRLQHSPSLTPAMWTTVAGNPVRNGSRWELSVPALLDQGYYRLVRP